MAEPIPEILTGPARWRRSSLNETARDAARSATVKAPSLQARVLAILKASESPLSAENLADIMAQAGPRPLFTTIWSRLSDLKSAGLIADGGARAKATGGCMATCWRALSDTEIAAKAVTA